jgi:cobalt/nickel transport system permease protein/cobalt/nickel transport protein
MTRRAWSLSALIAALIVAGVLSYWASAAPDGLEKTSAAAGIRPPENTPALPAPLKDYKVAGLANPFLSNGLAGLAGTLLVLVLVVAAGRLLTRKT